MGGIIYILSRIAKVIFIITYRVFFEYDKEGQLSLCFIKGVFEE